MQRCHRGLAPAPVPLAVFSVLNLDAVCSQLAGVQPAYKLQSSRYYTNSLYSECWKDSTVQRKASGDI